MGHICCKNVFYVKCGWLKFYQRRIMTLSLDETDRGLLFHLSLNGRIGITQLADKMNISKQMAAYRLGRLQEQGIIKRFYAITNIYRLRKTHYRVFIKFQNLTIEKELELKEYLVNHPKIAWVIYLDGDFDMFFVVWSENIIEFEKVYDDIMGRYGTFFQEKNFSIATRIEYLPYHFISPEAPQTGASLLFGASYSYWEMDDLDKKLLNILNRNGRESLASLARQLNVTSKKAKARLDELIHSGIIIGFNLKVNHTLLGYVYRKVLLKLNDTSRQNLEQLTAYLKRQPSIIYLLKTIGPYDFEFELMTRSNEEFYNIVKDLRIRFSTNIKNLNMVIMKEEAKFEDLQLD